MTAFDSAVIAAQKLSEPERLQLLAILWDSVPDASEFPLHDGWAAEIERRVLALRKGAATTPWSEVRNAALARIGHGEVR